MDSRFIHLDACATRTPLAERPGPQARSQTSHYSILKELHLRHSRTPRGVQKRRRTIHRLFRLPTRRESFFSSPGLRFRGPRPGGRTPQNNRTGTIPRISHHANQSGAFFSPPPQNPPKPARHTLPRNSAAALRRPAAAGGSGTTAASRRSRIAIEVLAIRIPAG